MNLLRNKLKFSKVYGVKQLSKFGLKNTIFLLSTNKGLYVVKIFGSLTGWSCELNTSEYICTKNKHLTPKTLFASKTDMNWPFIVRKYMPGFDLKKAINLESSKMKIDEIMVRVLNGMKTLHSIKKSKTIIDHPKNGVDEVKRNITNVFGRDLEFTRQSFKRWEASPLLKIWMSGQGFIAGDSLLLRHSDLSSNNIILQPNSSSLATFIDLENAGIGTVAHDYGSLLFSLITNISQEKTRRQVIKLLLSSIERKLIIELPFYIATRALCTCLHYYQYHEPKKVQKWLQISRILLTEDLKKLELEKLIGTMR